MVGNGRLFSLCLACLWFGLRGFGHEYFRNKVAKNSYPQKITTLV
ncbi:hypothetical protein LPM_2032 [Legionella pneumophila subsp. pneumophila str. Mississauga]|nr:hypothetical protein LPM_2032 [Legionella pneumophila subsp. pneumophila str. Mississauga]